MGSNVTVITVAHRLQTIMDADKIVRSILPFFPSVPFDKHETIDGP